MTKAKRSHTQIEQDFELTENIFDFEIKESPTNPTMETPVKAGAEGNSLNVMDQSTIRQWTANSWKSGYPSGSTPKTLKVAENEDTARRYWEQIFKEDGASRMLGTI